MANPKHPDSSAFREAVEALHEEARQPVLVPPIFPPILRLGNSGLYTAQSVVILPPIHPPLHPPIPIPIPHPEPDPFHPIESASETEVGALPILPLFNRSELRLDVDGWYPQMQASGLIRRKLVQEASWIARLKRTAPNTYTGEIWHKDGQLSVMPYTQVLIEVSRTLLKPNSAKVTFSGPGLTPFVVTCTYQSPSFHPLQLEFDCAEGVEPVLAFNTGSHPNRPATLPVENLSVATVFRRAGFDVSIAPSGPKVPLALSGADGRWSDAEMHDAMQTYWSHFADRPQWSMWTFLAALSDVGANLGGIMFDDIGPNHRQGCAIFTDSFISQAPAGDPAPAAWVQRMKFWTTVHEMGHCLNLAHAWQESLGTPWIPIPDEPEARTFMNYPYRVAGSTSAFFANFEYRFSDAELLFLRHAPYRYTQPGNADWFDHHGFQMDVADLEPAFRLRVELADGGRPLDFLEPPVVHLVLTNTSGQPQLVPEKILADHAHLTFILKRNGRPARELTPFSHACWKDQAVVLKPGESLRESVFLVGRNGWDVAEPGRYVLQASLEVQGQAIVSAPAALRIAAPKNRDEEVLAQDVFSDEVGRVLAMDGSRFLESANDTLQEVVARLPKSRAAIHAHVALAACRGVAFKSLTIRDGAVRLEPARSDVQAFNKLLTLLEGDREACAATLGEVDYHYYLHRMQVLAKGGAPKGNEIRVTAGR